jgi:O-acetyl-ADP-ribose deacetylase (regulator of RNase III)
MIRFTTGNLFDADVDAIVNTVNTMGVMGKGIALMFKERYPENYEAYAAACKAKQVELGKMFVTASGELSGPKWIINFPTKANWRFPSKLAWIESGLEDLKRLIVENGIRSIAIPPLGAGNGGLDWRDVRPLIEAALGDLRDVEVVVYEPTAAYQNVTKTTGKEELTPARALVAEMVRRYEVMGFDCSVLEVQNLGWMLTRVIHQLGLVDPLKLKFEANRYGPYADNLRHLLDNLDGSFLHAEKRLADAKPGDALHFAPDHGARLAAYFRTADGAPYVEAIEATDTLIDGFQSPLGMEALATVDWLMTQENVAPTIEAIRRGIDRWPTPGAAARKQKLFTDRLLKAAIDRLTASPISH